MSLHGLVGVLARHACFKVTLKLPNGFAGPSSPVRIVSSSAKTLSARMVRSVAPAAIAARTSTSIVRKLRAAPCAVTK